tara:strand:+ start:13042 stop:14772 length:1731 start_codon:yes stop_codon:yes gene_type:complete
MVNKNHKFCVLFATRNYYDMFQECLYKYSKSDWKDVIVLNVDINSNTEDKERGKKICSKLGIHFINPDINYVSCQQSVAAADEYLLKKNIDVDWIVQFQHDVFPAIPDFWDRLNDNLNYIEEYKDKVAMFGANVYQYVNYQEALELAKNPDLVTRYKTGTATGRGCLESGILDKGCWYKNLPDEYYLQKYFVVESPMWTCGGFNRKLFRENIVPDEKMKFELWPDDIAHQFLKKNFINISFPDLLTIHDHALKPSSCVSINRGNTTQKDYGPEQLRFIEKHGWRWGYRQYDGPFFKDIQDQYVDTTQEKIYNNNLDSGPKLIEDYLDEFYVKMSDIIYSYDEIKNILLTDDQVKGDFIFDDNFLHQVNKIYDGKFDYDFTNKTVALIGNSPNLLEKEFGDKIDKYDIVIRCNHSPIKKYEKYVGTKTNFRILSSKVFGYDEITSLSKFDHNYLSELDDQHFIIKMPLNRFPNHSLYGFEKNFGGKNKITVIKDEFQQNIIKNLQFKEPSTGLFALILFLSVVEKVDMFGFDFYQNIGKTKDLHYFEEVGHIPSHDFSQEYNIVKSLIKIGRVELFL